MINNKSEFKYYVKSESLIQSSSFIKCYVYSYIKFQPISRFLLLLRTCEYYMNCKKGKFNKLLFILLKYHKYRLGLKLGFTIPENVFGSGLQIPHYGTIVVNAKSRIGKNCRLHVCTNIGTSGGSLEAPTIGDNVYIAPGVKIYGNIKIANNISFAANSAVNRDCMDENALYGGVPVAKIKNLIGT